MNTPSRFVIDTIDYIAQALCDPVVHPAWAAQMQAEIDRNTLLRAAKAVFVDLLLPSYCDDKAILLRAGSAKPGDSASVRKTG